MNKWIGIGRLVKAPEARTTPNGVSVTTFTVAISRRRDRETTDFINIVTWRGLADNCAKYLQKGQQVAVTGELQIRSYDAKDGTKKYITEIQADDVEFLARSGEAKAEFAEEAEEIMMDDDMLPF
jgi:single-strand DNA-binding protein